MDNNINKPIFTEDSVWILSNPNLNPVKFKSKSANKYFSIFPLRFLKFIQLHRMCGLLNFISSVFKLFFFFRMNRES